MVSESGAGTSLCLLQRTGGGDNVAFKTDIERFLLFAVPRQHTSGIKHKMMPARAETCPSEVVGNAA